MSTTSAGDTGPNETVVDTGIAVTENVEENVEVSSRHSETHRSGKEPSIANSRSSRRREIDHIELENMRAKREADHRLRERQSQLEKEREEIELRRRQEELRLHLQQQQQEQELRLQLQPQEDELRLRQYERELENERKKAEADEERRVLKLELTKGSSRACGSEAGNLESVGSRRKPPITQDWLKSVAERSGPSRPLSQNVVVKLPKNVTQERSDKRCSAYPKTTTLFQPGVEIFSPPRQEPSFLKRSEIPKSIRVTDPPVHLSRTTFQQQGTSTVLNKQRSQSPKHNSRNRFMESRNQKTLSQPTPPVIYQQVPSDGPRGLPKLKLTEFSGDPLEWPEWCELFDVILHQKKLSDTEKLQYLKTSLTGQAKAAISGLGFSSQSYYQAWDVLCKRFGRPRVIVEAQLKKIYTHPPVRHDDSSSIVRFANVVINTVKVLTRLGFQPDLESEGVLISATRKLSLQLKEQ